MLECCEGELGSEGGETGGFRGRQGFRLHGGYGAERLKKGDARSNENERDEHARDGSRQFQKKFPHLPYSTTRTKNNYRLIRRN